MSMLRVIGCENLDLLHASKLNFSHDSIIAGPKHRPIAPSQLHLWFTQHQLQICNTIIFLLGC
jgi:hypothetical protein